MNPPPRSTRTPKPFSAGIISALLVFQSFPALAASAVAGLASESSRSASPLALSIPTSAGSALSPALNSAPTSGILFLSPAIPAAAAAGLFRGPAVSRAAEPLAAAPTESNGAPAGEAKPFSPPARTSGLPSSALHRVQALGLATAGETRPSDAAAAQSARAAWDEDRALDAVIQEMDIPQEEKTPPPAGQVPAKRLGEAQTFGIEMEMIGVAREDLAHAIRSLTGGVIRKYIDPDDESKTFTVKMPDKRHYKIEDDYTLGADRRAEIVSPISRGENDITLVKRIAIAAAALGAIASDHCGIHVHVGAKAATVEHICRLIDLMIKAEPRVISGLFGMNHDRLDKFAKFISQDKIDAFRAHRPTNMDELREWWYGKGYDPERAKNRQDSSRNSGLNLQSLFFRGTIEFRYFDGTLDPKKIERYIRFVISAAEIAGFPGIAPSLKK